jgi:hypothetical protein
MASRAIEAIAEYNKDVELSLRLYFSKVSPSFGVRFLGLRPGEISAQLLDHLRETDQRSVFVILTRLEAAFLTDYEYRCKKNLKDRGLTNAFRDIRRSRKRKVRLKDDILNAWKRNRPELRRIIGDLRSAIDFRDWFAHRRYTEPPPGGKYDFQSMYGLADAVLNTFPLQEPD